MVQGLGFRALRALESRFLSSEQGQDEEGGRRAGQHAGL